MPRDESTATEIGFAAGDLISAIAAAKAEVETISKNGRNRHDGYNYASIDDFLGLVNPICAKHGLVTWMDEAEIEDITRHGRKGETQWIRARYTITVYHSSGQSLPPVRRSVEVLRNGAQAYGSAQSYALKQFLRALLEIPTGDADDADKGATDDGEWSRQERPQPPRQEPPRQEPPRQAPNHEPVQVGEIRNRIKADLEGAATVAVLQEVWRQAQAAMSSLPEPMRLELTAAKDKRKGELTPISQTIPEDEIPY